MFSHQKAVLFIGDIAMLAVSFCIMALVRFDVGAQGTHIWYQIQVFALLFTLWLIIFFVFELYNLRNINPNPRTVGLLIAAMVTNIVIGIVLFYLIPGTGITPKTNLAILATSALLLLIAWRRIFYFLFTKRFSRRIILVGNHPLIDELAREITRHRYLGIITNRFNVLPHHEQVSTGDIIIVDNAHPKSLVRFLEQAHVDMYSLHEAYETFFGKIPVELIDETIALHLMTNRLSSAQNFLYRIVEIVFAIIVLIVTSPFLLIAILAIYIEDGSPVFYTQTRVGKNGKLFTFFKLRSMRKDAESHSAQWAQKNDPRSTRVGSILRKLHIDEIPQMWSVIKGDLAFIGPRAERPEFVTKLEEEIPYYYLRHTIKPGFTGWAQIKFRYAATVLDSKEKFEYDLYYLKNKHPLLDIGIVLKTIQIIFTH